MGSIAAFCIGVFLLYWPYLWCWYRREDPELYGLRWSADRRAVAETLAVTAAVLAVLTAVALAWPWEELPRRRGLHAVLELAASGLAAAVIEETFFRGWLQPVFARRLGPYAAIVAVNLIFAPVHLFAAPYWISLCTFFPGLVMGWLKYRHDSLMPPALFHFLGNVWAIWFFPSPVGF